MRPRNTRQPARTATDSVLSSEKATQFAKAQLRRALRKLRRVVEVSHYSDDSDLLLTEIRAHIRHVLEVLDNGR